MKNKSKKHTAAGRNKKTSAPLKVTLAGLLALVHAAKAQDVIAPPPQFSTTSSAEQEVQMNDEMNVFNTGETVPGASAETQPFRWKDLTLRPHPFYRFLYGDGILAAPSQLANTTIQDISPGVLLDLGDHWALDFTPTWTVYSNPLFRNAFSASATLNGGVEYGDWIFKLTQGYVQSSSLSAETATQIRQNAYATTVDGLYNINGQMTFDLTANQNILSADQFTSYDEWSGQGSLSYQFWPRFNASLIGGGGYDDVSTGPNMSFENVRAQVNWRLTDKISFQVFGGLEDRQFLSGGASDLISPIFEASVQYQPFEPTRIILKVRQEVLPSYLQDQVSKKTDLSADLNQRLFQRFFLDLSGGYWKVKYISSLNSSTSNRNDDYAYVNAALNCSFLKRGTVGVFYQIGKDLSSQSGFSFTSHQIGFQINYAY